MPYRRASALFIESPSGSDCDSLSGYVVVLWYDNETIPGAKWRSMEMARP